MTNLGAGGKTPVADAAPSPPAPPSAPDWLASAAAPRPAATERGTVGVWKQGGTEGGGG